MIRVYPAVFAKEENGYSVFVPDFGNVATCGDDLEEAIFMAMDLIAMLIYVGREEGKAAPIPSQLADIDPKEIADYLDEEYNPEKWFVLPVCVDAEEYAERNFGETVSIQVRIATSTWNAICNSEEYIDIDAVAEGALHAAVETAQHQ